MPNAINERGQTPLHEAARFDDPFITEMLLLHGADVNARSAKKHGFDVAGSTPLQIAARFNHVKVMELLLSRGADVSAASDNGETALRKAILGHSETAARLLLEHGAQHDVFTAAALGNERVLLAILSSGVSIQSREPFHFRTPLHFASDWGQMTTLKLLIDSCATVEARDFGARTPLHHADNGAVAKFLIQSGASVDARSKSGQTPLRYTNNGEVATVLIEYGADIKRRDNLGETALHNCTKQKAQVLLLSGADIDAKDSEGRTPIVSLLWQDCVDEYALDAIEYLLASGADANAKDNEGNTPLHHATFMDSVEAVRLLLAYNGNVNAANNEGLIPIDYASEEVAEMLRNYWNAR